MRIDLKGNTSQYSTTGKNLYDINNFSYAQQFQVTSNISNGIITTTPTSGTSSPWFITIKPEIIVEPNQQYTLSFNVNGSLAKPRLYSVDPQGYYEFTGNITNNRYVGTITIPNNINSVRLMFYYNQGATTTISNIMFEKGNVANPTYEPYTGGNPAPNPSYPEPVNVVTGDNEVNVVGKNLVNTLTKIGNSIFFNGSTSQEVVQFEAGTYTLSFINSNTISIYIMNKDGSSSRVGTNSPVTFTTTQKFNIWLYRSGITLEEFSNVQLEKSSQATSYEPYQSQTYPIYLGVENLFNKGATGVSQGGYKAEIDTG